jgi:hypothetical protein
MSSSLKKKLASRFEDYWSEVFTSSNIFSIIFIKAARLLIGVEVVQQYRLIHNQGHGRVKWAIWPLKLPVAEPSTWCRARNRWRRKSATRLKPCAFWQRRVVSLVVFLEECVLRVVSTRRIQGCLLRSPRFFAGRNPPPCMVGFWAPLFAHCNNWLMHNFSFFLSSSRFYSNNKKWSIIVGKFTFFACFSHHTARRNFKMYDICYNNEHEFKNTILYMIWISCTCEIQICL